MAHEVESMMYVGETPWHGLGVRLNEPPTIKKAIEEAGLDWEVDVHPLILPNGKPSEKARVVMRETDGRELGVVGMKWTPLQNRDAFDWFEPFLENDLATIDTAGSLREGERVWVLAKLKAQNSEVLKGDEISKFLLLSNGHDGKLAVRVGFTPIRVVCQNTLSYAHNHGISQLIRVRHTGNVLDSVESLRDCINAASMSFEVTVEQYKYLAKNGCNELDLARYVKEVFNEKEDRKRKSRIFNEVVPLFESGKGTDIKGVRGTWWGAYNAVTEFINWKQGRDADSRMDKVWFGANKRLNDKALETATRMAA